MLSSYQAGVRIVLLSLVCLTACAPRAIGPAERVVHEFGRQVSAAMEALTRLHWSASRSVADRQLLTALETTLETLRSEFRVLAPYEVSGRLPRLRDVSLYDSAELALTLNQKSLQEQGVYVDQLATALKAGLTVHDLLSGDRG